MFGGKHSLRNIRTKPFEKLSKYMILRTDSYLVNLTREKVILQLIYLNESFTYNDTLKEIIAKLKENEKN